MAGSGVDRRMLRKGSGGGRERILGDKARVSRSQEDDVMRGRRDATEPGCGGQVAGHPKRACLTTHESSDGECPGSSDAVAGQSRRLQ